jgi:hypothetical protein
VNFTLQSLRDIARIGGAIWQLRIDLAEMTRSTLPFYCNWF